MKLLITIVQDQNVAGLLEALTERRFSVTKLASTGGFLRTGNTTLLIGVDDPRMDEVLRTIKQACPRQDTTDTPAGTPPVRSAPMSVGGAIVFSVDVERFEKI